MCQNENVGFSVNENFHIIFQGLSTGSDLFRACCFVREWAILMEKEMENGGKLSDVYQDCLEKTKQGTSKFSNLQFSFVLFVLMNCWNYSNELKEIYNKINFNAVSS